MNAPALQLEAPERAAVRLARRHVHGGARVEALHGYRFADGTVWCWKIRARLPDGSKALRPMRASGQGYVLSEPPAPPAGKPLYRLPELLTAAADAPIFVCEGEWCCDHLHALGIAATTTGSCTSADGGDWAPLKGRSVIAWPDHDAPGARYALDVARHLQGLGCGVRLIAPEVIEALPEGGDCVDWIAQHPGAAAADILALPTIEATRGTGGTAVLASPGAGLMPLPDPLPGVPTFDVDLLPQSLHGWCADLADGLQCPIDFVAIPAMVGLAASIGRSIGVRMKANDHWVERPVLWGAVIGRPSSGKSPALAPARRMLERLARAERDVYDDAQREYEARLMVADAGKANAKKAIQRALKAGDKTGAQQAAEDSTFDEEEPTEPRIVTNDATVEKVGVMLNQNPRGLVLIRDELSGWLASMDREGRESDRAFWLECWNGTGEYTCDRISRGTIRVVACAVSVLGGMQPGKLAAYVRGAVRGGFADDGLMQRFQLGVYPDVPASWTYTDRAPDPDAEAQAWGAFQRLRNLDAAAVGAESAPWCDVPFVSFDGEAQALLVEWMTKTMQGLRAGNEPQWLESHFAKYPALAGRLALVLHLADGHTGAVSGATLARALNWCEYLQGHARRIYSPAADNGLTGARLIEKRRSELGDRFTARDLYRRCWAGMADPDDAQEAIDTLVEYGHLITVPVESGGRPSVTYQWRDA